MDGQSKELGEWLQDLSRKLMKLVSEGDISHSLIRRYISPDFQNKMVESCDSSVMTAKSLTQHLENMRRRAYLNGDYQFKVKASYSGITPEQDSATVWLILNIRGWYTEDHEQEGIGRWQWSKQGREW
jgi:aromatic ring-opening dioxygenase catalytic subunit (LigB family)